MIFNLKGFRLSVSFPSVAILTFIVINNYNKGYLFSFISILLHETGHLIAMFLCGCKPDGFEISAFDIKILNAKKYYLNFYADYFITIAGPLINIILYLVFFSINRTFSYVNLFIGLFNLLPASTLDGGQLLFMILCKKLSPDLSGKIVDYLTISASFPLFFIGLYVLLNSEYNFSLLFISIYLILSIFFKKDKTF